MRFHVRTIFSCFFLLSVGNWSCENTADPTPQEEVVSILPGAFPKPLELPALWNNGVYDCTVEGDPESGRVWMVYSGVDLIDGYSLVSTHLAYSDDGGATWQYTGVINQWEQVARKDFPAEYSDARAAFWQHEVPSLVYDKGAPPNEQWRLLWHRYLHVDDNIDGNDDRKITYGWIGTKTASSPEELTDAPERKLFSSFGYNLTPEIAAYNWLSHDSIPGSS
jgi:hypothetical protein